MGIPELKWLFVPVVIGFLIYSMVKDSNFLFYDNFYLVVFLISGCLSLTTPGAWGGLRYRAELYGYFVVFLMFIVFCITFFMALKVLEWYPKPDLGYKEK